MEVKLDTGGGVVHVSSLTSIDDPFTPSNAVKRSNLSLGDGGAWLGLSVAFFVDRHQKRIYPEAMEKQCMCLPDYFYKLFLKHPVQTLIVVKL